MPNVAPESPSDSSKSGLVRRILRGIRGRSGASGDLEAILSLKRAGWVVTANERGEAVCRHPKITTSKEISVRDALEIQAVLDSCGV